MLESSCSVQLQQTRTVRVSCHCHSHCHCHYRHPPPSPVYIFPLLLHLLLCGHLQDGDVLPLASILLSNGCLWANCMTPCHLIVNTTLNNVTFITLFVTARGPTGQQLAELADLSHHPDHCYVIFVRCNRCQCVTWCCCVRLSRVLHVGSHFGCRHPQCLLETINATAPAADPGPCCIACLHGIDGMPWQWSTRFYSVSSNSLTLCPTVRQDVNGADSLCRCC